LILVVEDFVLGYEAMFPTFLEELAASICSVVKERHYAGYSYVWSNFQIYGVVVLAPGLNVGNSVFLTFCKKVWALAEN
jgi:hypothetical protein